VDIQCLSKEERTQVLDLLEAFLDFLGQLRTAKAGPRVPQPARLTRIVQRWGDSIHNH
jgi:hypothetical protein